MNTTGLIPRLRQALAEQSCGRNTTARDRRPPEGAGLSAPLSPPATEAELNEASRVWTKAQDIMVKRGYGRHLWGNQRKCCHEFVVLMLRQSKIRNPKSKIA
jgi:hypothetical protein